MTTTISVFSLLAFLAALLAVTPAAIPATAPAGPDEVAATSERLLRHVVLFSFKPEATAADVKRVEDAFAALPGQIEEIAGFEWGTNNSPEGLDRGYTHCFLVTFASEADRATYLPHPAHQAFVDVLRPHLAAALVVDYWAQP